MLTSLQVVMACPKAMAFFALRRYALVVMEVFSSWLVSHPASMENMRLSGLNPSGSQVRSPSPSLSAGASQHVSFGSWTALDEPQKTSTKVHPVPATFATIFARGTF